MFLQLDVLIWLMHAQLDRGGSARHWSRIGTGQGLRNISSLFNMKAELGQYQSLWGKHRPLVRDAFCAVHDLIAYFIAL